MSREPAQVVGRINIRPCRLGLVFKPELAILCRAVEHATTAWGGMYFPFLSPDEERDTRSLATVLSVDALHALDEGSLSTKLSELPGFRWNIGLPSNPFEAEEGLPTTRILGPDWLLDLTHDTTFVLPRWEPSDPLEKLFTVWFGRYDSSSYGLNLAERFRTIAEEIEVDPAAAVPNVADRLTPLDSTALEIAYAGDTGSPSFMVLNAQSPSELIAFWNMRAWGQPVFPWPRGYDDRLLPAAESWLRLMINTGRLGRSQSGTGEDLGPFIRVATKRREQVPGHWLSYFVNTT